MILMKKNLVCGVAKKEREKRKGSLDDEKVAELEKIKDGIGTKIISMKNTNEIIEWVNTHNKIPSPSSNNKIEKQMGTWCVNQRKKYKNETLDTNKINELEKIIGWFWEKEDLFEEKYKELKNMGYKNEKITVIR